MTAGIEIRRDSDDALLMTYNLQNPFLVDEGNVSTVTTTLPDGAGSIATVPNTGTIRTLYCAPGISFHKTDTTHWWCSGPAGTVVTYRHFDTGTPVNTNVGIEVYGDAVGSPLMFGSGAGNKVLRADNCIVNASDTPPSKPSTKQQQVAHGVVGWYLQDDETVNPSTNEPDGQHWIQRRYVYSIGFTGTGFGTGIVITPHLVDAPLSDPGWVVHVGTQRPTEDHPQVFFLLVDCTGY